MCDVPKTDVMVDTLGTTAGVCPAGMHVYQSGHTGPEHDVSGKVPG